MGAGEGGTKIKKSYFMFSLHFVLFPIFLGWRVVWVKKRVSKIKFLVQTALLKPDHITGSPVVTRIQVSFLGHVDISSSSRWLGGGGGKNQV